MKCCKEYAALLDLFVDGELTPEDMRRKATWRNAPGAGLMWTTRWLSVPGSHAWRTPWCRRALPRA